MRRNSFQRLLGGVHQAGGEEPSKHPTRPRFIRSLGFVCVLLCNLNLTAQSQPNQSLDHVILISVDGLRSDALTTLPTGSLLGFEELLQGSYTLNARTDPHKTVTLPNHVGMLTGLPCNGEHGHGWEFNHKVPEQNTLHAIRGEFTPGIFHIASPNGVATSLVAAKNKFQVFPLSWNDNQEELIDYYAFEPEAMNGVSLLFDFIEQNRHGRTLNFWHLREMDVAGHTDGWIVEPKSAYMNSLKVVDAAISSLLRKLELDVELKKRTAILLTSDHGGGHPLKNHWGQGLHPLNWTIPFIAWSGNGDFSGDIYAQNQHALQDPNLGMGDPDAKPPIRNIDIGNLGLGLLGLPNAPNSTQAGFKLHF